MGRNDPPLLILRRVTIRTFKSTYQILKELSYVWDDLSDITQANILEMIGGKRNSNVVAALLTNFETAEKVVQTASNSMGSALRENEIYLESVAGRMDKLTASWEALSNTIISNDIIKFFISTVTAIVDAADAVAQFIGGAGALLSIAPIAISLYNNFDQVKNVVDGVAKAFTSFVGGVKRYSFEYAHCIVMVTWNESVNPARRYIANGSEHVLR